MSSGKWQTFCLNLNVLTDKLSANLSACSWLRLLLALSVTIIDINSRKKCYTSDIITLTLQVL